ncbi:MAG: hypothetical protein AAF383_02165 [Cyanobacteria bacterium P01_A01_bin.83]
MSKGFAKVLSVESRPLPLPFGETVAYRQNNKGEIYADLDHCVDLLGIGFLPEEAGMKITLVRPINGKFKGQTRRAIVCNEIDEIVSQAAKEGDKVADEFRQQMVLEGMKKFNIEGAVIENGCLIPVTKDGTLLEQFAIPLGDDDLPPELQKLIE